MGPFVAPADVLLTDTRYRSKQAATTEDPFVAVYGADVEFPKKRQVRGAGDDQAARRHAHRRDRPGRRSRPRAPTRSRASATRRRRSTPTRWRAPRATSPRSTRAIPPSDMHDVDFADVVGKKPVALLFSTPQLCQSRVCGPVTDIELQMKSKYGDKMDFIHQEVYVDNDINKGLRRAAAGSSTCRPSRGCSSSTRRARSPRGSRARSACSSSRTPSSPACESGSRSSRRRWPPPSLVPGGRGGARARPAPAAADPAVAVRVGGGRGARDLVLRAGRAVAAAAAGAGQLAAAAGRARRSRALPVQIALRRDRRLPAGRDDPGRLPRRGHGAGQLGADVHADHVLGRDGVRLDPVRRRLPRVQPVAGDRAAAAVAEPALPGAARALAGGGRAARLHLDRAGLAAGARTRRCS